MYVRETLKIKFNFSVLKHPEFHIVGCDITDLFGEHDGRHAR